MWNILHQSIFKTPGVDCPFLYFQIGMFMVCLKMFNDTSDVIWPLSSDKVLESDVGVGHCNSDKGHLDKGHCNSDKEFGRCKSSMLRYKTHLFHFAETISRLPRFVRPDRMGSLHCTIFVLFCAFFIQWSMFPSVHFSSPARLIAKHEQYF